VKEIAEASTVAFKKMYASVGSFARELNSNSKGLVRYGRRNGIPLITVRSRDGSREQSFIHTKEKTFIAAHYKTGSSERSRPYEVRNPFPMSLVPNQEVKILVLHLAPLRSQKANLFIASICAEMYRQSWRILQVDWRVALVLFSGADI
jgi:hypothetical protein